MVLGHSKGIDLRHIVFEYEWNVFTNNKVMANITLSEKKNVKGQHNLKVTNLGLHGSNSFKRFCSQEHCVWL